MTTKSLTDINLAFEGKPSDSPLVDSIWYTRTEQAGAFISSAAIHCGIVFSKYEGKTTVTVRGPETKATDAEFPAGAEFIGINFTLGTFMPHIPARLVMDRQDINLPEASSRAFWLNASAWELPTFKNADTFIDRLVRQNLLVNEPIVDAVIQGQPQDLSIRTVQYRFLHATGLTQSTVRQIERARRAVALLQGGTSILDTTYELGYFDQAHLTRSLRRFMGQTPAQIARVNPPE
jgi:AraC-like DNA-binding protein